MTDEQRPTGRYWWRHTDGSGAWRKKEEEPPGEHLASLRRGAGREPGSVPEMWPFLHPTDDERYVHPGSDMWDLPAQDVAEHHALVLFGIHQQSVRRPVHVKGVGVGAALRALRWSDRFSQEAVDRRFHAMITAESMGELTHHLRGLVRQLKTLPQVQALDYGRLEDDLAAWQDPYRRDRVRRRWGRDYHSLARPTDDATTD